MAVATSRITLQLYGQSGVDIVGARVTLQLTDYDLASDGGGVIAPRLLEFTTDANGLALMDLWSNDRGVRDTQYILNVYHPVTGRKVMDNQLITVPDFDTTINAILTNTTNSQPIASFTMTPTNGKAPIAVTLDASTSTDSDGSIVAYSWSVDGVVVGSGVSYAHTFTAGGTFSVSLTVTDNNGATHSVSNNIVIDPVIGPSAGFTVSDLTPDQGDTVTLTDTSIVADYPISTVEYDWGYGEGWTADNTRLVTVIGDHTVTQRVTDSEGNQDTTSLVISTQASAVYQATQTVNALSAAAPVANFTTTPSTGSTPLRVTIDPTATTIVGWQAAKDEVDALPASAEKTALLAQLQAMLDDLQFVFNYAA